MKPRFIPAGSLPDCLREEGIDPPIAGLWSIGADLSDLEPRVAIVGARRATAYGLDVARTLGADLAAAGVVVVSGMALGIDAAAHAGALSIPDGRTVAIFAGGVDRPYPERNAHLYPRILERGAVLSETPPGSDHRAECFLSRNRIIAAISLGVVLVQADPRKSGALTTMRVARDLHRELFAVPGDIRAGVAGGPHDVIKGGGHLCTSADDVLEVLDVEIKRARERTSPIPAGLNDDELAVLAALADGPARAETVGARAARDPVTAIRTLTRLELAGLVRRERNGSYRRTR